MLASLATIKNIALKKNDSDLPCCSPPSRKQQPWLSHPRRPAAWPPAAGAPSSPPGGWSPVRARIAAGTMLLRRPRPAAPPAIDGSRSNPALDAVRPLAAQSVRPPSTAMPWPPPARRCWLPSAWPRHRCLSPTSGCLPWTTVSRLGPPPGVTRKHLACLIRPAAAVGGASLPDTHDAFLLQTPTAANGATSATPLARYGVGAGVGRARHGAAAVILMPNSLPWRSQGWLLLLCSCVGAAARHRTRCCCVGAASQAEHDPCARCC
jgi:hypothetical protein